jgi:hypothetical protein
VSERDRQRRDRERERERERREREIMIDRSERLSQDDLRNRPEVI